MHGLGLWLLLPTCLSPTQNAGPCRQALMAATEAVTDLAVQQGEAADGAPRRSLIDNALAGHDKIRSTGGSILPNRPPAGQYRIE